MNQYICVDEPVLISSNSLLLDLDLAYESDWKVIVSSNDKTMHLTVQDTLVKTQFQNRNFRILSAFSVLETVKVLNENYDAGAIVLDCSLDRKNWAIEIIKYIRLTQKNKIIRIITKVDDNDEFINENMIVDYEIDNFINSSNYNGRRLFVNVVAALRAYRGMSLLEANRKSLEKVVSASNQLSKNFSVTEFIKNILHQIISIVCAEGEITQDSLSSFISEKIDGDYYLSYGDGIYAKHVNLRMKPALPKNIKKEFLESFETDNIFINDNNFFTRFNSIFGTESIIHIRTRKKMSMWNSDLLKVFSTNIKVAFENLSLTREIEDTQKEVIFTLGGIAEARSKETGNHVKRVAEYTRILSEGYGLSVGESDLIKQASPMHDIGKIAIPDNILNKPGKLSIEEYQIMKTHSTIGYEMLKKSQRPIMKAASIIANQHHEKYDGSGYPSGLKGDEIHIYGRITAIADVFDALASRRVYKEAWDYNSILNFFRTERNKHFDAKLVDILLENFDKFVKIKNNFPD